MARVAIPLLLLWLAACTGGRRPLVPIEMPPAPLAGNSPSGAPAVRVEQPPPPVTISIPAPAADLAEIMTADPALRLVVEGYCDERGSAEFILALGDRRAESVRELLTQLGVTAARVDTVSYGEGKPQCTEATADCWQKNRRARIRYER
ncbi:MAG: hypothetical protein FJW31_28610 [Acidobacteria bacterium]|nr:hypothetical protein [Acidobacteriota bacterium]